jgi:hypothetical protein
MKRKRREGRKNTGRKEKLKRKRGHIWKDRKSQSVIYI